MDFIDCNLSYGPDTMKGELPGCPDIGGLVSQLDRAGIAGGLVYYAMNEPIQGNAVIAHDMAKSTTKDGFSGNSVIANDIAGSPRLRGVWSLLPSCTGEVAPPCKLPAAMKQNNIAALAFNPKANRFLPKPSVIGDYLEVAQEHAIPVLLNTGRGLELEEADSIMRDFPKLTAILTFNNCWPSDRLLRPFIEAYPNLCLDTAYMFTDSYLPELVKKYSAKRILFGSAYPVSYPGANMMVIKHAEISDEDKRLIAGENLLRIIGEARYDE